MSADRHKLGSIDDDFVSETTQKTHRIENTLLFDLEMQTSPPKWLQTQKSGTAMEEFWWTQTGNGLVLSRKSLKICQTEI